MGKIEVALTTKDFINQKSDKLISYRPKGSVIVSIHEPRLRMAWVTRVGYHASPAYRYKYPEPKPVYFQTLVDLWRKSWYDSFVAANNGDISWIEAWDDISESGLVTAGCGLDYRGDIPLVDTWCWSKKELKLYAVMDIDDTTVPEGEELGGFEEELDTDGETVITRTKSVINYRTDLGMSGPTLDEIDDDTFEFHPRHNYKVNFNKVKKVSYKDRNK